MTSDETIKEMEEKFLESLDPIERKLLAEDPDAIQHSTKDLVNESK